MTALALLDDLDQRGVRFRIDGARLRWVAPVGVVTDADLAALRRHKAEAVAILREDERDRLEERAAIMELDGKMTPDEAERRAQADIK